MSQTPQTKLLIGFVGDAFMEGVKEAAEEAGRIFSNQTGGAANMLVLPNLTVMPPWGLGAMHNFIVGQAILGGYDHLLIMHNDVLMDDPQTIVKLMGKGKMFITPYFNQDAVPEGPQKINQIPGLKKEVMHLPNQGVLRLEWTVPYCTLYNTAIFKLTGPRPFCETAIYCQDEYDSMLIRIHGFSLWQDTDTSVKLLRGPSLLADTVGQLKILKPFEHPMWNKPEGSPEPSPATPEYRP